MFSKSPAAARCIALGLLVGGVLLVAVPTGAGVLDASWTAPTTNTDGSSLTDLASYRVYYGTSSSPCPGASFFQVASSTPSPSPNQTITVRLTGLATGTLYYVSVTAVVTRGAESACTTSANAVARLDFAVNPTGTMNFGSVNLGSSADQTFTVSNLEPATGGGTVSGTASAPAPFSIVSGSPFTLGVGASQAVTVRFSPTMSATATVNLTFAADRDTTSRIVTGSGTDTTPPTVAITSPTSSSTYSTGSSPLTLGGTAADHVGVTQVMWANSRGGSGTASGTTSWAASGIVLQLGTNVLTVTARDAAGNTATASLTATLSNTAPPTVAITAPTAGATVAGTVTVSASASANVVGVQFRLDGNNLGAEVASPPYSVSWGTTTTANGTHTLTAVGRDAPGNTATSAPVSVNVSNRTGRHKKH